MLSPYTPTNFPKTKLIHNPIMVYPGTDTTLLFHQQLANDNITVPYTYIITGGNIANLKLNELQSFLAFDSRYSCYVAERFDLPS